MTRQAWTATTDDGTADARPEGGRWAAARINLRTLNTIRWIAIAGQTVTLLTVEDLVGIDIPLLPALAVTAVSLLINLYAIARRRRSPFLTERGAVLFLGYDTVQLTVLLMLTGGLENPFAVLVLAPLMVGASMLGRRLVTGLTTLTTACLTLVWALAMPLSWPASNGVTLSPIYLGGIWAALTLSAIFIATYVYKVAQSGRDLSQALIASQVSLARAQKASALGALAAAAAHELGSPLGTIAVVAKELARDMPPDSPWVEDIQLLQSQSDRCRVILADLARRPDAEGEMEPYAPLGPVQVIEAVAAPHRRADVTLDITVTGAEEGAPSPLPLSPELQHGLGNILQNAMQFATTRVDVTLHCDPSALVLTVADDGPGFPVSLLERLGEPYVSDRDERLEQVPVRAGGGGTMGLGLFIAQILLERTGAVVSYANGRPGSTPVGAGAHVTVNWSGPLPAAQ
ncbi:ActS/PrrB/RegB family redox-sensitive histidine kinase [Nitrospirillum viridazoti]|uniref:histidine kinase n=1 Tax=Nitrospirillum viridazoti CBAmc TaxID=1441467 RepID=A0A248JNX4_9PROT|nr:ActS/PrrB/RegB family redox-sensitive histidine kinase [Nitrospirillum amazonense]ASG19768.1 two-component sensor histidine kinase [Nitrospirillum amazonense CBAmc]TWB26805.1 two-component system sensor histidine kinase RegB [Nitrospirillum amazonense]